MQALRIVLIVLEVITSVLLTTVVLLQSGKESGLSGVISGNNTDTYLGKSKAGGLDKKLATSTKWIGLVWVLLALSLSFV